MNKIIGMTIATLLMACCQTMANFSGGDDFNDNSRNVSKWSELVGTADRSLDESNGRLEMLSSGVSGVDPDSGVWRWIENSGSTTQDWTIVYDVVNELDINANTNNEIWFGIFVSSGAVGDFDNGTAIEFVRGNYGVPYQKVGVGAAADGDEVFDANSPVATNALTLRMQYDAFTQRIHYSYDEGNGFQDMGSMSISVWGMSASDDFDIYLFGGTDATPVSSGQVYGDNFTLVPTSEYVEPETIIGHPNFSGTDDFNDNSIDSAKWENHHQDSGTAFNEVNGRFEFTSPSPGGDRSTAWEWTANQGSYTQSWTITYQAVNTMNPTNVPEGIENWFGLAVLKDSPSFDNSFHVSVGMGTFGGTPSYDIGSEGSTGGVTVVDYSEPVTSDSITMRLSYDALTKMLYSSYDEGAGFISLENMNVSVWNMDESDSFTAVFYSGNNGMIVTSGQIYAENVILEPSAKHLNEDAAELAKHIRDVEIYAGYNLDTGLFEIEFELWSDGTFSEVIVNAPFGTFICEEEWDEWNHEAYDIPTNGVPSIDGDWQIVVIRTNGLSSTTSIPFMQVDGITPVPVVLTCPVLTSPILPSNEWILAQDVTFVWDSDFDTNANFAGIEAWNEVSDADLEYVTYEGILPTTHTYGPVTIEPGIAEIWFFNSFEVVATNSDGVAYELGRFAYRLMEVSVIDPEWDEDLDGMSNEWELEYYGGVTNGSASADSDGDGCNNLDEFRNGSNPTNEASCFEITLSPDTGSNELTLGWTSVPGREYDVHWTTNLADGFELAASYLTFPQNSYMDTLVDSAFYRLDIWRSIASPNGVQRKEIMVDGVASDWSGLSTHLTDPAGDGGAYSGLDITGITIAMGISNLFFSIDRVGTQIAPSNEYSNIWIHLNSGGRGTSYAVSIFQEAGSGYVSTSLHDSTVETNWVWLAESDDILVNTDNSSIELSVPLAPLNLIDRYGLTFYTHSTTNQIWEDNGDSNDNGVVIVMPY